jgi:hypothetical protein
MKWVLVIMAEHMMRAKKLIGKMDLEQFIVL